jgi:hypothetical protein
VLRGFIDVQSDRFGMGHDFGHNVKATILDCGFFGA